MPTVSDILWFKRSFQDRIRVAIADTPLTLDFIAALACQETGEVWPILRRRELSEARILELCVGDTLDQDKGRSAFPTTKGDLLAVENGPQMFQIAHQALVDMAQYIDSYRSAASKPNKFCRGYGIFQLDLQFFHPKYKKQNYFLNREYATFEASFRECMIELRAALRRQGYSKRKDLTDEELAEIGIVYNTGGFNKKRGLRQGIQYKGKYYGEFLIEYIRLARTVAVSPDMPSIPAPPPGQAILPPARTLQEAGSLKAVSTAGLTLRLRSQPKRSRPTDLNVIAEIPEGHSVLDLGTGNARFSHIETTFGDEIFQGYVAKEFLAHMPASVVPAQSAPIIPEAALRPRPGVVIRRREKQDAFSLNEPNQPSRAGTIPDQLRAEIREIIGWLAVDRPSHVRYQKDRYTYCNIYCHDFCHLAGVYMPRVWWTAKALALIAQGTAVKVEYERTVEEVRVNGLFRWLRDFGTEFGWRRVASLSELQSAANLGAVCLIMARNKSEGPPGHVAMVVPESNQLAAIRNNQGEVKAPVQSQAGSSNFQYGTGAKDWWKGDRFAESAFWVHP